jgi:anti-sigma factor RsiW
MVESNTMMNCFEVEQWLAEYLTGVLAWPERADFARHLAGCAECGKRVESLEQMNATVRRYLGRCPKPRPSDIPLSLLRAILSLVENPPNPGNWCDRGN